VKKRVALVCFVIALVVSVFGLAACGGGDEAQQPNNQQGDQGVQPSPSPAQSGNRVGSGLIGTWELTHLMGNPVDPGTTTQTFEADGTAQSISTDFLGGNITETGQYKVIDDSHLQLIHSDGRSNPIQEYSLEGDTLRLYTENTEYPDVSPERLEQTYRRTS
jgi:hypothetical protein